MGPARERQDATFMARALELAEAAVTRGQTPFGAVVVDRDGQLVGEGHWTPLEVVGDFMRARALEIITAFPWGQAQSRAPVEPAG